MDVIKRVCEKVPNSIGFLYGPRIRVRPCTSRVHGRVRAVYTVVTTSCTRAVYRLYMAVYTAVYKTCSPPCTGRVHGHCSTLYTGRVHGLHMAVYTVVYTGCVPGCVHVYGPGTRVHGRVHANLRAI